MTTPPLTPEALSKQALGLAWAGGAAGSFEPFLAFAERAMEHIPRLDIKDKGPFTDNQVQLGVLRDCCLSAVQYPDDPAARAALVKTIVAIDATWPQSAIQRQCMQSSLGQTTIAPVLTAIFYDLGASHPDLTMEVLQAVPSLLFTNVRRVGESDFPLLQAAVEKNFPEIVSALLKHDPLTALTSVAGKMRYIHGAERGEGDLLHDLLLSAAKSPHVGPLDVLIQFSSTPEAATLGIEPVDGDKRCRLANLSTNDAVRLRLVSDVLAQPDVSAPLDEKLRHLYGLAVGAGHLNTAAQLREHGFTKNAVMDAVYHEDAKLSWLEEALLAPEADVNEQFADVNGSTPLHMAALRGNIDNVARLLLAGADPKLVNSAGQTPYRVADKSIKMQFKTMLDARAAHGKVADVVAQVRRNAASAAS